MEDIENFEELQYLLLNESLDVLLEKKGVDEDTITVVLSHFYSHLIKYVTFPNKQSSGWIGTIKNCSKAICKIKSKYPSLYKNYNISDNLDVISKLIWIDIENDGNDIRNKKNYKLFPIGYFNTLDKVADLSIVQKFLNDMLCSQKENLLTSIYK